MAFKLADRVLETSTSTGTGSFVLAGARDGYQSFTDALANGDTTYYTITDGTDWEVGLGTWTESTATLARTTVLSSSNSGSAVDFGAGTKDVFISYPSAKFAEDTTAALLKSGGTMIGALTTGSNITLTGAQTGGYPTLGLRSGSSSTSYITMGTSSDPDEGYIQYAPSIDTMFFGAGTVNAFNIKSTGPQLGRDMDLNGYKMTQGSAGSTQRSIDTGNINCGVTGSFSMYLGYQGTYSFDITNGQFNQSFSRIAKFTSNGSCELYNIGLLKLKTNTYGIEVRGDATNGSGAIQLNCENNSHGVKIKAPPHSAAASYTLTLPNDDGTSGQVLSTDGSGGLSWVSNSGGGATESFTTTTGYSTSIDNFFNLDNDWKMVELVVANQSTANTIGNFHAEYGITGVDTTISFTYNRMYQSSSGNSINMTSYSNQLQYDDFAIGASLRPAGVFFVRMTRRTQSTTDYLSYDVQYPDTLDRFVKSSGVRSISLSSNQKFIKIYKGGGSNSPISYAIRVYT